MKVRSKLVLGSAFQIFSSALVLSPAQAMGPKPPGNQPPVYTLPNPARDVIVRQFQNVKAFETPNQVTTTLDQAQAELGSLLQNAVTQTGVFHVIQGTPSELPNTCGKHLEINPQVIEFELDGLDATFQFGFNSSGTINVGQPSAKATDEIKMGNVSFTLGLFECDNSPGGSCSSLISTEADQSVLSNNFTFSLTWSQITGGGDIFNKTDLGAAVGKIFASGMAAIVASPLMSSSVPWSTPVLSVNANGTITMGAGEAVGVLPNQYFTVYAAMNPGSGGGCGVVNQALACVATGEVDGPSSIASVYQVLQAGSTRSIQVGDIVEVGAGSCTPASASRSTYADYHTHRN